MPVFTNMSIEELQQFVLAAADSNEKADALMELAKKTVATDAPKAEEYSNESLQLAKQLNYKFGEGAVFAFKGNQERIKGNFFDSLECNRYARDCFEANGNKLQVAQMCNNMGIAYNHISELSSALECYLQALKIYEDLKETSGQARVMNNIGTVYQEIGNSEKAMEYYQAAKAINEESNDLSMLPRNYNNIGVLYRDAKQFAEALNYFEKALHLHEKTGDVNGILLCYGNMGVVLEDMGEFERALQHSMKALQLSEETGNKDMVAFNSATVGNSHTGLNDYANGLKFLTQSLVTAREIGSLNWEKTALTSLVAFYEKQNLWREALEHYRLADEVNEKINKEEVQRKAGTMEIQRKLDKEEAQRTATEKILHNILPQKIAERIKEGEEEIIERFENCTVLFADMVGFTRWSETKNVNELAAVLNRIFSLFDELANEFGVEKIKTIGDAYMCVSGLPEPCTDHAARMAKMALAMNAKIQGAFPDDNIRLRIGIHTGEVVAGVIGKNRYAYDLWGDTVNTASRMESHGMESKIQVSEEFKNCLPSGFRFEERGVIDIKGKGKMRTWFLTAEV
ncbi:MAG: tetratricopeptide repeat protein [Chitinophagales bacterium]|nr:tetratricopeptide repeat protein [Chitinophagales bacterium]